MTNTKQAARVVVWMVTNAGWAWLAWTAVNGSEIAGNVLKFGLWFTFAQAVILCVPTEASAKLTAKGPPAPLQLMLLYDVAFAGLLAAFGWFGYATIAVVSGFLQASIYTRSDEPQQATEPAA